MIQTKHKAMHETLQDRDMVVLVAVIVILIAIVLVCCKQSVPAAIMVVFVIMLLGLSMDSSSKLVIKEAPLTASRLNKVPKVQQQTLPPVKQRVQISPAHFGQASGHVSGGHVSGQPSFPLQRDAYGMAFASLPLGVPVGTYNSVMNQAVPRQEGDYCGEPSSPVEYNPVVKDITVTNVPVLQNDPHVAPKKCTINSAYTEFDPPEMASTQSDTYQDLYVLPTEITRPPGKSIAEVKAKTNIKCIKKEIGSFPKPDRLQGTDVFIEQDEPVQLELARLQRQAETNSLICQPSGSSTLDAALDVSPPPRPNYNYVKPMPDYDKDMKRKIRNEGLYGIQGDLNCVTMRRSAVADTGFIQPLEARTEYLRYLAYDMPNYRNQWQTARSNTVNSDTRYFK